MSSHGVGGGGGSSRRSMSLNAMPNKKKQPVENGSNEGSRKSLSASSRSASLYVSNSTWFHIRMCVCVDIIGFLVFISFVSGKVDWCKFVYLIVMKFEKWGEFEMFWKHLFDNGMLCMNMGGNSCLLVGSVSCQLMTIRLYGLMLTQQVVNPFFRFYGKKEKIGANLSINSIVLNCEKPNK